MRGDGDETPNREVGSSRPLRTKRPKEGFFTEPLLVCTIPVVSSIRPSREKDRLSGAAAKL
jgi:hypothetical protein